MSISSCCGAACAVSEILNLIEQLEAEGLTGEEILLRVKAKALEIKASADSGYY